MSAGPTDPAEIEAEIVATRVRLGRTVDELHARLDVSSRARERFYRARDTAVETYRESPPVVGGALAGLTLATALVVRGRKRATRRRTR